MGGSHKGICQICGNEGILTDDHLPPKALYPKKIRPSIINMNTIKACPSCNNGSNNEDELFKVIVGNLAHSFWEGEMWNSTVSTLDKNQKLDRLLEENSRHENINGELKSEKILKLNNELKNMFLSVMERIAKGLFYQEYNEVLVINREISIFHPDTIHQNKTDEIEKNLLNSKWKSVNNESCHYVFVNMFKTDIVLIVELFSSINLYYVIQNKRNLTSDCGVNPINFPL